MWGGHAPIHPANQGVQAQGRRLDAAVSIHFKYFSFAPPQSLANPYPQTPAIATGISDHVWKIDEIVAHLGSSAKVIRSNRSGTMLRQDPGPF
jgi:hypothetical protein